MTTFGNNARDLVYQLKTALDPSHNNSNNGANAPIVLPAYNDHLVRDCLQDLQIHVQALQDQVEANNNSGKTNGSSQQQQPTRLPHNVRPSIMLQKAAISRNKRCLLAYHQKRLEVLTEAYWSGQQLQHDLLQDNSNNDNLAPSEQTFCTEYEKLIQNYQTAIGFDADLRSQRQPPLSLTDKCQVRVLTSSQGPIVLESGATVDLVQGAVHYLLWSDVEGMVRGGSLELLAAEEDAAAHPLLTAAVAGS